MINSIYRIKDYSDPNFQEDIEVEGSGQEAAKAILKKYRNFKVILKGFLNKETNEFIPLILK